ncbi:MAG: hypothetical protein WAV09_04170 [Minisyncoccia bacterium]
MTIHIETTTPAVCKNKECENYRAFEEYNLEEVKKNDIGEDYVICEECGERIYLDE